MNSEPHKSYSDLPCSLVSIVFMYLCHHCTIKVESAKTWIESA